MVVRTNSFARQASPLTGGDHLDNDNGVTCMLEILRNHFAPGAAGLNYQGVDCTSQYRRADQTIDENTAVLDARRREAESAM